MKKLSLSNFILIKVNNLRSLVAAIPKNKLSRSYLLHLPIMPLSVSLGLVAVIRIVWCAWGFTYSQ
jgi:hypothetical protein